MPFRRFLGLSAAASGHLVRGFSTATRRRPPWAVMRKIIAVNTPATTRTSLELSEPPCASRLVVPGRLICPQHDLDPPGDTVYVAFAGIVKAASADGLLLLTFFDIAADAPVVPGGGSVSAGGGVRVRRRVVNGISMDPDVMRFVCNPLSGQLFRLPDIDGAAKTARYSNVGILTQSGSGRPDQPPDKYAVAVLSRDQQDRGFVMRRFLSQTGKWDDKPVALPCPLPLAARPRPMYMDTLHEAVAFAGRLWWVDVTCGALSVDPFSDTPELRFTELPRGSVTEPMDMVRREELSRYRRIGVSEGRLRYAEVSQEEPFLLSSFALDDDGSCWTLEHRVALRRLLPHEDLLWDESTPQIAVVDPLNASVMHLTIGNQALSLDMATGNLLRRMLICEPGRQSDVKPCVLPPWLQSSKIPSAGTLLRNKNNAKSNTLSDMLVRVDRNRKN